MIGPIYPFSHIAAFYRNRAAFEWSRFAELMEKASLYQMASH